MLDPSADLQLCFHLFSKKTGGGWSRWCQLYRELLMCHYCSDVLLLTEACCGVVFSHCLLLLTRGKDLIVWVNTVFCGFIFFFFNHFHIHVQLHLTTGTVLFPPSSHAIPANSRAPYGYRFGVEAVCNSFGACFEGPVVFSGGQQSKQVIGRMEWLFKNAVCLLQAAGGEDVVLGS